MRLLLTGSNGFLGSRVAGDARKRGWQVVGLGRSVVPARPTDAYVSHDLAQPLPAGAIAGPIDAVVHVAALASPWAAPRAFVSANVDGTRNIARWAAHHGAPPLIYISSTSVLYRDADQCGLTEDDPVPPDDEQINVYSRTKRIGERIVAQYPGPWAILRPRAIIGAGDTVLMPRIVRLASCGLLPHLVSHRGHCVRSDVTDVGTVAHYITEAVDRRVTGLYHLTNAQPVDLYPFLLDVLGRMGMSPRLVPVPAAIARCAAGIGEQVSALLLGWREPPITRFGVSVLSRSKTFDVTKTLRDLGKPWVSLSECIDQMVREYTTTAKGGNK